MNGAVDVIPGNRAAPRVAAVVVCVTLLMAGQLHAQAATGLDARALKAHAQEAEKRGDRGQALQMYEELLSATDDVTVRLSLARLHRELGELDAEARQLRALLTETKDKRLLKQARVALSANGGAVARHGRLAIETPVALQLVKVDGVALREGRLLAWVLPGAHQVEVVNTAGVSDRQVVQVEAGDHVVLRFMESPVVQAPQVVPDAPTTPAPQAPDVAQVAEAPVQVTAPPPTAPSDAAPAAVLPETREAQAPVAAQPLPQVSALPETTPGPNHLLRGVSALLASGSAAFMVVGVTGVLAALGAGLGVAGAAALDQSQVSAGRRHVFPWLAVAAGLVVGSSTPLPLGLGVVALVMALGLGTAATVVLARS